MTIPPPLLEAMAEAVLETASFADVTCLVNPKSVAIEAIAAAERAGYVLVARTDLKWAGDIVAVAARELRGAMAPETKSEWQELARSLRDAAGEGT